MALIYVATAAGNSVYQNLDPTRLRTLGVHAWLRRLSLVDDVVDGDLFYFRPKLARRISTAIHVMSNMNACNGYSREYFAVMVSRLGAHL